MVSSGCKCWRSAQANNPQKARAVAERMGRREPALGLDGLPMLLAWRWPRWAGPGDLCYRRCFEFWKVDLIGAQTSIWPRGTGSCARTSLRVDASRHSDLLANQRFQPLIGRTFDLVHVASRRRCPTRTGCSRRRSGCGLRGRHRRVGKDIVFENPSSLSDVRRSARDLVFAIETPDEDRRGWLTGSCRGLSSRTRRVLRLTCGQRRLGQGERSR